MTLVLFIISWIAVAILYARFTRTGGWLAMMADPRHWSDRMYHVGPLLVIILYLIFWPMLTILKLINVVVEICQKQ